MTTPPPSDKEAAYTQVCSDADFLSDYLKLLPQVAAGSRARAIAKLETEAESLLHNLRILRWWEIGPPAPDDKAKAAAGGDFMMALGIFAFFALCFIVWILT